MAQEIGNSNTKTLADLYDHEKVRFIHPVINAQWHAKVGLLFLYTLYKIASYTYEMLSFLEEIPTPV